MVKEELVSVQGKLESEQELVRVQELVKVLEHVQELERVQEVRVNVLEGKEREGTWEILLLLHSTFFLGQEEEQAILLKRDEVHNLQVEEAYLLEQEG